ncbi:MAG TPA: helix-turn-helix domain-containing protein [Terriglobales bacterium]|nr:helix-turn-helix domain-containing protein [Terriglobales bacterium]
MANSFSTDLVPVADRLDAWLFRAKQICGDCRFQFPRRSSFHGCIERRTVAGLELTRFSSTPVSFAKFPVVSASSPDRSCIVITQLEGVRRYQQQDALAILHPGDTTLLDSGQPWSSDCAGQCSRLYLRVPIWLMQNRLRLTKLPTLPHISGMSGLGVTLFQFLASLFQEAEAFAADEGASAIDAYLQILSACLRRTSSAFEGVSRHDQFGECIDNFIENHLAEPTLGPTAIAEAAGISVRHLHRLFSARGRRVAEWIRERRLERCRADFGDRRFSEKNITEIAFSWGFSDSAHFSRCFKERFGMSPREFRSRVISGGWEPPRGQVSLLAPGVRLWPLN